jgi:hypothetical protein
VVLVDEEVQSYAIQAEHEVQTEEVPRDTKSRAIQTPVQVFQEVETQCDEVFLEIS